MWEQPDSWSSGGGVRHTRPGTSFLDHKELVVGMVGRVRVRSAGAGA